MKKIIYVLVVLVALGTSIVSCHKSEEIELSSQCYITSFQLGTVKRILHTTSSLGVDSTYTTTISASTIRMAIDHRAGTITNVDLLLSGAQLDKVPITITSQGTVVHASAADTSAWTVYSTKDSIDFTQPVIFRVLANDNHGYRDYTATIKVRENTPNDFTWTKICTIDGFADKTDAQLLMHETTGVNPVTTPLLLSCTAAGETFVSYPFGHHAITPFPTGWETVPCEGLTGGDVRKAVSYKNFIWMNDSTGQLYRSSDGRVWDSVPQADGATKIFLFTASETALYARVRKGETDIISTSTDGTTWQPTMFADEPFTDVSAALAYTQANGNHRVLVLSDVFDGDADCPLFAWSLLEGHDEPWVVFNDLTTVYPLPRWHHPVLTPYNGWLMALGDADWAGNHKALDDIYISYDNGLNWKTNSYLAAPSELRGTTGTITAAAYGEYIWVIADGQLWALRYNSYGEGS